MRTLSYILFYCLQYIFTYIYIYDRMKRKLFVMDTNSTVEMDEDIAKASSAPRSKISLIDLHDHYPPPPNPQTIIATSNSIQEDLDEISKKEQLHLNALRQRALASMIKKPPSLVPPHWYHPHW